MNIAADYLLHLPLSGNNKINGFGSYKSAIMTCSVSDVDA